MAEASARAPLQGDTATSAAAGEPQYHPYKSIADARKQGRVCLFAAVAEIGPALKSSGGTGDHYVTLRIVDKSHPAGVSTTIFAENTAQLPGVKLNGDVISLHDVEIKKHGEHFYVKFNKSISSFALFEGKVSARCIPYQASTKYHGSNHDKELLTNMRTWLTDLPDNSLGLKGPELQLRSLKSDSTFDLVCKVLHVLQHNDKWIFYVWDGTDTPAAEFQRISDAEEVASPLISPPLLEGPPLPKKVLCKMPCVGSILRISSDSYFNKIRHNKILHMQEGIYWARFCNITCKQEFGVWKGIFSDTSGVRLLSNEDGSVVDHLKTYYSRNAKKVRCRPMTSLPSNVTDVDVDCKKGLHSTLMESLTYDKELTHKVKTLVRVVGAYPCRPSEVPWLLTGKYCMLLTLEDPTARIHACVSTDELVKFFGCDPLTEEVVMKKMKKLLGVPEAEDSEEVDPLTRNPPWVWCCLKSYYLDENDPWGSRRYQIYGTTIRD